MSWPLAQNFHVLGESESFTVQRQSVTDDQGDGVACQQVTVTVGSLTAGPGAKFYPGGACSGNVVSTVCFERR